MMISLIGIGTGSKRELTIEALNAIDAAQVLIGASRMVKDYSDGKKVFVSYKPEEICEIIRTQEPEARIAVLLSGDVGFYSGAKKLLAFLQENLPDLSANDVRVIPGISSVIYLAAKLQTSWQEARFVSIHGKSEPTSKVLCNIVREEKVFTLLSGREQYIELLKKLEWYGMTDIQTAIGTRLSYEDEVILTGTVSEVLQDERLQSLDDLAVAMFENQHPIDRSMSAIEDDAFIRGDVPMTKSEVRTISISKLGLQKDSVVYDIGAGTGSVSVEAALRCFEGTVYAVERKHNAVELIEKNKRKFAADNLEIIEGLAPEAFESLPAPTHCFIGGSAGNLIEILDAVWSKNETAKIVINAVSLDTVGVLTQLIKEKHLKADIVLAAISKNREMAGYQMMMAYNPVYIVTLKGNEV